MKVYTSYFGNLKKLKEADVVAIGIALYPPRWFSGVSVKSVSPTKSILFAEGQSNEEYVRRYKNEVLSKLNVDEFLKSVGIFGGGHDVALCCYEKPEDFCHRHILAEWLNERYGMDIQEFGQEKQSIQDEGVSEKPEAVQMDLGFEF